MVDTKVAVAEHGTRPSARATDASPGVDEILAARREATFWRFTASELEQQLTELKNSRSWRITAPLRFVEGLFANRSISWSTLIALTAGAILTLPLWPLFGLMILFPFGRHILWNLASRLGEPGRFMQARVAEYLQQRMKKRQGIGDTARRIKIFQRNAGAGVDAERLPAGDSAALFLQLSPQRGSLTRKNLFPADEITGDTKQSALSMCSSEVSIMRAIVALERHRDEAAL